jgi:flagellar protein FliL
MSAKKEDKKKPEPAAEGAEGEAPAKKKLAGKQLILFIVLPAILVLGGGGAAAFFLLGKKPEPAVAEGGKDAHGKGDKKDEKKEAKKGDKEEGKKGEGKEGKEGEATVAIKEGPNGEAFYTLPDVVVNIATTDGKPAYLRLKLSLQTADVETAETIAPAMPVILDQYTAFLRELRMEDIAGSAGSTRLRLELLKRVNLAVAPAIVQAVLVEEMLVQ